MAQQIIVYIIGAAVLLYIGIAVYHMVTKHRNPCYGCTGCDLKTEFQYKQRECDKGRTTGDSSGNDAACGCGCGT